jgi:hypothetical protein
VFARCQAGATDYERWDLWAPSDDEDDALGARPPSSPAFRALERDIDERHQRFASALGGHAVRDGAALTSTDFFSMRCVHAESTTGALPLQFAKLQEMT